MTPVLLLELFIGGWVAGAVAVIVTAGFRR
jgi:hypothetical protein